MRNGPDTSAAPFPPEGFDPRNYAHVEAWRRTLPNFFANGRWYSNERFGVVAYGPAGESVAVHRVRNPGPRKPKRVPYGLNNGGQFEARQVEKDPYEYSDGDPPTYDPVEWTPELVRSYERLRDYLVDLGNDYMSDGWLGAYREQAPRRKTGERM